MTRQQSGSMVRFILVGACTVAICGGAFLFIDRSADLYEPLRSAVGRVFRLAEQYRDMGSLSAAALIVGLYVATSLLLIPGFYLTYGTGALYGFPRGIVIVSTGLTLGAMIAFLASRYLLRDKVIRRVATRELAGTLYHATDKAGFLVVLLTRLCPVIPFRVSNYVFGVTRVPLTAYLLATWIGTLPSAALYTYVGTLLPSVGGGERGPAEPDWNTQLLLLSGLCLVFLVAYAFSRQTLQRLLTKPKEWEP